MSLCLKDFRLNLISFPRKDKCIWAHSIVKNVAFKNREHHFFHYTENSSEISIIMDVDTMATDFIYANRVGSVEDLEVYSLFQIDNKLSESPAKRINEISLMLASYGISIFYLCTYQTDFLLVKENKVNVALGVLKNWASTQSGSGNFELLFENPGGRVVPLSLHDNVPTQPILKSSFVIDDFFRQQFQKIAPHTIGETDLSIAGFSVDFSHSWALNVIQLLLYSSKTTPKNQAASESTCEHTQERFISFTSSPEGVSLIAEEESLSSFEEHVLNRDLTIKTLKQIQFNLVEFDLDTHGIVHSLSYPLASAGLDLLYLSTFSSANLLIKNSDLPLVKNILARSTTTI